MSSVVSKDDGIIIYYWGPTMMKMYGRAIGIYLTLNQAGAKYDMQPPNKMPPGGSFAPPCLSMDGVLMGQAPMILSALGEKYGLGGHNAQEKLIVMHMLGDVNDIAVEVMDKKFDDEKRKDKWFAYLEKQLEGRKWLAGTSAPTVADFHGVFAMEWIKKFGYDFSAYPNINKWWADIQTYPVVQDLYASLKPNGLTMLP